TLLNQARGGSVPAMSCVVCGGPIAEPYYANAWEKTRKLYACCSTACTAKFDADAHWLPAAPPKHVDADEQRRLLHLARGRIPNGDLPSVVVRELLVAGVGLLGIDKLLREAEYEANVEERKVKRRNILGAIGALFGRWHIHERRDQVVPEQLRAAAADLAAWR